MPRARLLACNVAVLAIAAGAGAVSGVVLFGDALAARPHEKALAVYLATMAGGSAFMIVVACGGLFRNLALFPLSKRRA